MLLVIAPMCILEVHQIDLKTTFLNRDLEEEICMKQLGILLHLDRIKKSLVKYLYGLKQAAKQ